MLIVRASQLAAFSAVADDDLARRVAAKLRAHRGGVRVVLPAWSGVAATTVSALPEEMFRRLVRSGLERARGHGFTGESDLAAFVALMLEVAPGFDRDAAVARLLADVRVPAAHRIDVLLGQVTDAGWEAIRRDYDPADWNLSAPLAPAARAVNE